MAKTNKTNTEENIVDKTSTEEVIDKTDYKTENDKLKNEIEELKALMQQVIKTTQENKVETVKEIQPSQDVFGNLYGNEVEKEISPLKRINVTNLFDGQLNLRGLNGTLIQFAGFGTTLPVTYENLLHIANTHRKFAEEGYFLIHDKDVVDSLYLTHYYKKFINKEMIENIITLPTEKIKQIYDSITDHLREVVFNTIVNGVLIGDSNYSDRNKIYFISELYGKDIYATVELLRDKK